MISTGKRTVLGALATSIALISVAGAAVPPTDGADRSNWYRVRLAHGELPGHGWSFRATGPKHEPLSEICAEVGEFDLPQGGDLVAEAPFLTASETKLCGELPDPTQSTSIHTQLGSEETGVVTLITSIYRPLVREVVFVIGGGERRVYRTAAVKTPRRVARGIPMFRHHVALVEEGVCIQRIVTYDGQGSVITKERAEPGCSTG